MGVSVGVNVHGVSFMGASIGGNVVGVCAMGCSVGLNGIGVDTCAAFEISQSDLDISNPRGEGCELFCQFSLCGQLLFVNRCQVAG